MTAEFSACDTSGGCITCGDVAVALTVLELHGADALCGDTERRDEEGRTELVAIELVADVVVGDRVLVHAGVALERLEA